MLAKASYRIRSGKRATLHLHQTRLGKKALGSRAITKARLRIGGTTRTVRIRH